MQRFRCIQLLLILVLYVSCSSGDQNSEVESPTAILTNTQTALQVTATSPVPTTPIETPESELTPTIPQVPTPSAPDLTSDFLINFLYAEGEEDCQLPCWNNLEVDKSSLSEVQSVFEDLLGFDQLVIPLPRDFDAAPKSEFTALSYTWSDEQIPDFDGRFGILMLFDKWGQDLNGMDFFLGQDEMIGQVIPLRHVLEVEGEPNFALASADYVGQGNSSAIEMTVLLIYAQGMSFVYLFKAPTVSPDSSEMCFGSIEYEIAELIVTSPIDNILSLKPSQQILFGYLLESTKPLKVLFGIENTEIVNRITTESNPCFLLTE